MVNACLQMKAFKMLWAGRKFPVRRNFNNLFKNGKLVQWKSQAPESSNGSDCPCPRPWLSLPSTPCQPPGATIPCCSWPGHGVGPGCQTLPCQGPGDPCHPTPAPGGCITGLLSALQKHTPAYLGQISSQCAFFFLINKFMFKTQMH